MSILSTQNAKLTRDYLETVLLDHNYDIIDELLVPHSINYTDFGISVGAEEIKHNAQDWFKIFTDIDLKFTDQIVTDESVMYRLIETARHSGAPFKSIPPSDKTISFEVMVMFRINEGKITANHFSANIENMVRQLVGDQQVDIDEILLKPIVSEENDAFLHKILSQLESFGIKLTAQQLRCLSLWFSGRTSKEIAVILHISHRTVESHLGMIKEKLACRRKKEIFDVLQQHSLLHILQECSHSILCQR